MSISIKLQVFEGPLDLLLHLIDVNKVNIYDIPIVLITDQYLEYMDAMDIKDMDIMSEFLVMAATLLKIKSKMLLPVEKNEEGEEEDPRADLVERLLEHKLYMYMARELKDQQLDASKHLYKGKTFPKDLVYEEPPVDLDELVGDMNIQKLHQIFKDVLKRQENKLDPIRSQYGKIEKEEVTLAECMSDLEAYAVEKKHFSFRRLIEKKQSKVYIIVTFLAILELMKSGKILIRQEDLFEDIIIDAI